MSNKCIIIGLKYNLKPEKADDKMWYFEIHYTKSSTC